MKQVLHDFRSGRVIVAEVPVPAADPKGVLVRNCFSAVSPGTERATMQTRSRNVVRTAFRRRDLVRRVLTKARRDGIIAAFNAVRHRLDVSTPLGYSSAGDVAEVGSQVTDIAVGQGVACAGARHANHAEYVCVPRLLCRPVRSGDLLGRPVLPQSLLNLVPHLGPLRLPRPVGRLSPPFSPRLAKAGPIAAVGPGTALQFAAARGGASSWAPRDSHMGEVMSLTLRDKFVFCQGMMSLVHRKVPMRGSCRSTTTYPRRPAMPTPEPRCTWDRKSRACLARRSLVAYDSSAFERFRRVPSADVRGTAYADQ